MNKNDINSIEIGIQTMNDMLDDPDYEPMQRGNAYTDKEIDSVRALWVLEHQLRYDGLVEGDLVVKNFRKKYDIKIPLQIVKWIVDFKSPYRKTPAKRKSINKLIKEAKRVENNSLYKIHELSNLSLEFKNKQDESRELIRLLRKYMRIVGGTFRLNKTLDGRQIEIVFPETKSSSYRGKKIIQRLRLFKNEHDALFFLAGFIQGHGVGQCLEIQKWETQVLYELQKRNN